MKQKKRLCIVLACILLCVAALPVRSAAADPTLLAISAHYTGETLEVGEVIPKDKIQVTASYSDGTTEEIKNYAMSTERVLTDGGNRVVIIYRGKTTEIYVYGKRASGIYATYNGEMISVGNKIGPDSITVYLQYTDYTTKEILDYRVVNPVIANVGNQKIQIVYNNMQTTVDVYGTQAKTVSMLTAVYEGEGAPQGYAVPERNMYVTALYTDGTTERIYNYSITPATVQNIGDNKMTVSFRGKTAECTVKGVELTAQNLEAVYKGGSVEVGDYVNAEDVTVTATYSDGSKAVVKDFTFSADRIAVTGENTIIINYAGQSTTIKVMGVARSGASYSNAASFTVKNNTYSAKVQVALPRRMSKDAIIGKSLKPDRVSRVLSKLKTEIIDYIAFDILLEDELQDDVFPLTMRLELPQKYKASGTDTYLYYTSNRKSVIARTALEPGADGVIEVTLFRTGTYILVNEKEIVEDDLPDPDDDYL